MYLLIFDLGSIFKKINVYQIEFLIKFYLRNMQTYQIIIITHQ